jgi:predicted ATPase
MGETPRLFPVLSGLCSVYAVAGEYQTAHGLAEQLLSLAHRQQAPTSRLLAAHYYLGMTSFFLGELAVSREHTEQAIALYDPQIHNPQVSGAAQDLGVDCRVYAAIALWFLGYPDQALKRIQEALTLARELAHPHSLAFALGWAARLHQSRREGQQTHEQAEAAITLSTDQGFPLYLALGTLLQGWALAEQACLPDGQGQREEGIAQIHQGLADYRATGAELATPYYLALLAETYGRGGQVGEGLTVMGEALAIAGKNEERFYEAELYRLKGELTLQKFQVSGFKFYPTLKRRRKLKRAF